MLTKPDLIQALGGPGAAAVEFFQDTNPGNLRFGSPGAPGNVAEFIVDLVVKVPHSIPHKAD